MITSNESIQFAGELVFETSQVRILHWAEEGNLSPFDSKIACLSQSIEIKNNIQLNTWINFVLL